MYLILLLLLWCITAGDKDLDQWMCLTLLFAVERSIKLPKIQSIFDLKQVNEGTGLINGKSVRA
jgi:hypothetical protein